MTLRSAARETHEEHKFRFDENVRGVLVVVAGSAALVGLAWGAMMILTSPDGWVTKAANSAIRDDVQLVSFAGDDAR